MTSCRLPGFYNKSLADRLTDLAKASGLPVADLAVYQTDGGLPPEAADHMIENVIGTHALPLGIGLNFLVNGRDVLVPMAVEEPSVVAGSSFMAKLARAKDIHQISVTAFYSGMRMGEVRHLTWEQVDLANGMINLNNSESFVTKSKKPRSIPMCLKVFDIFKTLNDAYKPGYDIKENIVFFKFYGIPYSSSYVSHYFKEALNKTSLSKDFKFHSLRHSFASMLVSKGVSLYVIKELLGHSDFATTQIYAHLESKSLKDTINLLNYRTTRSAANSAFRS